MLGGRRERGRRSLRALLFGVGGALPMLGWCLRNRAVTGTLTGERAPSAATLAQNLYASTDTLSQWLLPSVVPFWVRSGVFGVLVGMLGFRFFAPLTPQGWGELVTRRSWLPPELGGWRGEKPESRNPEDTAQRRRAMIPLCFCLVYAVYLLAAATLTDTDHLDDRLWSPLYVPLIWWGFATAQRLPTLSRPLARRLAVASLGVWLLYSGAQVVTTLRAKVAEGAGGFATDAWQQSALIAALHRHPPQGHFFSNAAGACYLLAGLSADEAPEKTDGAQAFEPIQDALDDESPTYLIWFRIEPSPEFVSDTEWRTHYKLTVVQNTDDGTIYRVASAR